MKWFGNSLNPVLTSKKAMDRGERLGVVGCKYRGIANTGRII
jgi:hypothetical protein